MIENIYSFIRNLAFSVWAVSTGVVNEFVQTKSFSGKYIAAHKLILLILAVFVIASHFLDKHNSTQEKVVYTFYFLLFLEFVIFIAVFLSVFAQG